MYAIRSYYVAVVFLVWISPALSVNNTYTVVIHGDGIDGFCDADGSPDGGKCTLREAIIAANANPGVDRNNFV